MLSSIFSAAGESSGISVTNFIICIAAALVLGLLSALVYMFRNSYTRSFLLSLILLPPMVCLVIMLVNGNLGAGVAVMGAFALVRFRSVAGNAREICSVFFSMSLGLALGMGYIWIAAIFFVVIALVNIIFALLPLGKATETERHLKIVIPENLDYTGLFDDIMSEYTAASELRSVKTTNLGSLYELDYRIKLKDAAREKAMIDAIRCRNGNLNIVCGRFAQKNEEL